MTTSLSSPSFFKSNFYHVRVSNLAQAASCTKRAKIQHFGLAKIYSKKGGAMRQGTLMHTKYSIPYKSFDRRVLRSRLFTTYGRVHKRTIDTLGKVIEVAGIPDDYKVLCRYSGNKPIEKTVSLVEVYTTRRKRLWTNEIAVKELQLQVYVWLMQPALEALGYSLHPRHYVEVYRQDDESLMQRSVVNSDTRIEKRICDIVESWHGLKGMRVPPAWVCKRCPRNIKSECDWFNRRLIKRK